jgi:hypothetical protein
MMTFYHTGKTSAFGYTNDINEITWLKQADIDFISDVDSFNFIHPELSKTAKFPGPFKVPLNGRTQFFGFSVSELHGIVTFFLDGFHLHYSTGAGIDNGNRLRYAILPE